MFTIDTYLPTRVIFGTGRLSELSTAELPGRKALICTTHTTRSSGKALIDRVCSQLKENGTEYAIFTDIKANPTKKSVEEGLEVARQEKCDFLIGLGGGSSIDCAKAIAIMMKSSGDLWD